MPEDVYEALADRARKQRRSVEQQAVADLASIPELETRNTRQAVIEKLRQSAPVLPAKALDPVQVVRDDRDRGR
jgi:hypothetical protein